MRFALVLFAVSLHPAPADDTPAPPPASAPAASFAGSWDTTFGLMTCTQDGQRVVGTYSAGGMPNRIEGRVEGRTLILQYFESNEQGEARFELAADGQSFTGQWRPRGETEWAEWEGRRADGAGATSSASLGFDGLWQTTYGPMRLATAGDAIRGTYAWNGVAQMVGKREPDGAFTFSYEQPDGEKGEGRFVLDPGGDSFAGTWKTTTGGGGDWRGFRTKPVPGRVWLIVLESHWENGLAAPEYSYGQMLRSFFTRVPNVQVRHRFVHSLADFRRWSSEAAYFAEPVVLYISSHGTSKGALIGSDVVGAKELIDCLKHIDDLRLLHFGACEVMSGDIPQQIAAARTNGQTRFPISGFTRTADWAGSAIVDFTYMELVLGRNMPPAEAAEQTRKLIKFADEDTTTAIPGSGFKLFAPEASDGGGASPATLGTQSTSAQPSPSAKE